jgi:CheY-like chemotaxis protein
MRRILIADDNDAIRGVLSQLLRRHDGWEVCADVKNGQEAVLKAIELKPNVIILDLAMPMMDGLQPTREINTDPARSPYYYLHSPQIFVA